MSERNEARNTARNETNEAGFSQDESKTGQVSRDENSPGGETSVMLVGEAARLLGVSRSTVQRLCAQWEANPHASPRPGIAFVWTSPDSGRVDAFGAPMQGRRRLLRSSVLAHKRAEDQRRARLAAELAELERDTNPSA